MPELPEVETVKNGMTPFLLHKTIVTVTLNRPDLRFPFPDGFVDRLQGRRVTGLSRRAKYILIHLDDGMVWVVHLGMSGSVAMAAAPGPAARKHDHVVITFADDQGQPDDQEQQVVLRYNDPRRFGFMALCSGNALETDALFAHLGPEPLGDDLSAAYLADRLKRKKTAIKVALLDQRLVVGVGNIYACESLFRAGINPKTPAMKVSRKKLDALVPVIRQVLQDALDSGGSSLRDFVHADGQMGYFQHAFQVYDREGQACVTCGTDIERITQQGRSTFWCPSCQK